MEHGEAVSNVKVNHDSGIATSATPEFFDPDIHPPPLGVQMWVMTSGGIAIRATWKQGSDFVAWYPLPKTPQWLKDKLSNAYLGKNRG